MPAPANARAAPQTGPRARLELDSLVGVVVLVIDVHPTTGDGHAAAHTSTDGREGAWPYGIGERASPAARTTRDTMSDAIHFHSDLYRREALELVAQRYRDKAHIELTDCGADVVARVEPLGHEGDLTALCDAFCTEAFAATV